MRSRRAVLAVAVAVVALGAVARPQQAGEGWIVHAVALAPDGGTVAFGRFHAERGTGVLCLADAATAVSREIACGVVLRDLRFAADGKRLAAAGDDGKLRIIDVAAAKVTAVHDAHRGWVLAVAVSPDGASLVSGGMDRVLRLADTATGKAHWHVQRDAAITAVAFAPDGRLACGLANGDVEVWTPGEAAPTTVFRQCDRAVQALAFTADGDRLAAAGRAEEGFVFDAARGIVSARWRGHAGRIRAMLLDRDGATAWVASDDRCIRRVRLADGTVLRELQLERVPMALARAPGGDLVVADAAGGVAKLRDR